MSRVRASTIALFVVGLLCTVGCTPNITGFDPSSANRMQRVKIQGEKLLLAAVEFDGGIVGSWVELGDNPDTTRTTIVPLNKPDLTLTPNPSAVRACSGSGCGSSATLITPATDPTVVPVNIGFAPFPPPKAVNCSFLGTPAVCVTVFGTGIYPGDASLVNPFSGPNDVRIDSNAGTPALGTTLLSETSMMIYYPTTVPVGPHKVWLKNSGRYDGKEGATSATFQRN